MSSNLSCHYTNLVQEKISSITPALEKYQAVLLMFLGFGGLSISLGIIYNLIRKYVYKDSNNLDTVFDAGGKVTLGLTAVTVTSQLLWPSDFLQQATLMSKTGLGGSLFFAIAIVADILVFPLLSLTLKSRAPGAKTFLQIVNARFGKLAHIVFCVIALLANLITLMNLILAAKAALQVLVKDISDEMILLILAFLFGSYCLIGGLGTTFYISYFTTAFTFISVLVFVVHISYKVTENSLTSQEHLYEAMSCIKASDGNYNNSFMTFRSRSGIIYGFIMLLMSASIGFCDQANWQSRIAAKPTQGVAGFFIAAYLWFAIPLTITTATSSIYLSMSYQNGTHLLNAKDIDSGFISPYVMQNVMGETGAFLLITMITMSLMSTGSGEIMAISSIIVYDIYKVYINPFRKNILTTECILCGKERIFKYEDDSSQNCDCVPVTQCKACSTDIQRRELSDLHVINYTCNIHGRYREYEDHLLRHKSWCMVWITICIIPYGFVIINSDVDLNWAVYTMQGLLSAFLWPLLLTILWTKCTNEGVVAGSVSGAMSYFTGLFIVAELVYEDGLNNFLVNTSQDYSLLAGICSGFVVSLSLTVVVSLLTHKINTENDAKRVWATTMAIDNPLSPWRRTYEEELQRIHVVEDISVTLAQMNTIFRKTWFVAGIGGSLSACMFCIVLPASVLSVGVLSFDQYSAWVYFCQIWLMISAAFAIVVPPIEEVVQIVREYNKQSVPNLKSKKLDIFENIEQKPLFHYKDRSLISPANT